MLKLFPEHDSNKGCVGHGSSLEMSGKKPQSRHLRTFGCITCKHILDDKQKKLHA